MKLKKQAYSIPGLIFAGLGGILMLYVVYALFFENNIGLTIKISIVSLLLLIISLVVTVKKNLTDKKKLEMQIQIQQESLDVHKEQLSILRDIRTEKISKLPEHESEWDPWLVILVLILIFLFIPLIILVIYILLKKD